MSCLQGIVVLPIWFLLCVLVSAMPVKHIKRNTTYGLRYW